MSNEYTVVMNEDLQELIERKVNARGVPINKDVQWSEKDGYFNYRVSLFRMDYIDAALSADPSKFDFDGALRVLNHANGMLHYGDVPREAIASREGFDALYKRARQRLNANDEYVRLLNENRSVRAALALAHAKFTDVPDCGQTRYRNDLVKSPAKIKVDY